MTTKSKKKRIPSGVYKNDNGVTLKEVRCASCNRFLCYEAIEVGIIQHGCHACKAITQVSMVPGEDDEAPENMQEVRCGKCGRFLYKEAIIKGNVRTKCRGCGKWNTLNISEDTVKNERDGGENEQG